VNQADMTENRSSELASNLNLLSTGFNHIIITALVKQKNAVILQ
jgi:hypothetical protein